MKLQKTRNIIVKTILCIMLIQFLINFYFAYHRTVFLHSLDSRVAGRASKLGFTYVEGEHSFFQKILKTQIYLPQENLEQNLEKVLGNDFFKIESKNNKEIYHYTKEEISAKDITLIIDIVSSSLTTDNVELRLSYYALETEREIYINRLFQKYIIFVVFIVFIYAYFFKNLK